MISTVMTQPYVRTVHLYRAAYVVREFWHLHCSNYSTNNIILFVVKGWKLIIFLFSND